MAKYPCEISNPARLAELARVKLTERLKQSTGGVQLVRTADGRTGVTAGGRHVGTLITTGGQNTTE